jgi:hypothetical protein
MVNRVLHLVEEQPGERQYDHFYTVETANDCFWVAFDTLLAIEYELDRAHRPLWIEFRDLFGARQRVLSCLVVRLSESTPATRASIRAFRRARKIENEQDGGSESWSCED